MSESCVAEPRGRAILRCLTHKEDWTRGEWPDPALPCPFAIDVAGLAVERVPSAPVATSRTTGTTRRSATSDDLGTELPLRIEAAVIQSSGVSGSATGKSEPADDPKPSKPSDAPSTPSTRHWATPRTAMDFAAQANKVATMILNGEIDVDTGRLYSSVARTVAQALSTEVSRARYLQNEPNLTFPEEVEIEED